MRQMNTSHFKSTGDAIEWLRLEPFVWRRFVYSRWAARALPSIEQTSESWLQFYAVTLFRANLVAWSSLAEINLNLSLTTKKSYVLDETQAALVEANRRAYDDNLAWDALVSAMGAILAMGGDDPELLMNWENDPNFRTKQPADRLQKQPEWVSLDCSILERQTPYKSISSLVSLTPLWSNGLPQELENEWRLLSKKLLKTDANYTVWIDWYERRVRGEPSAFDIPGDKRRIEDKKILRRLAEATDEDFWGKGHEYVNATLKGWLDEARARAAPSPISGEASGEFEITGSVTAELGPLPTPPQELGAIAYGVNEQGKLDRLPNSDQAHLRDVPDQRRAYDDLREAAAELLGEGQRLGHRLQRALDRFLHSLPDGFEDAEAYLVWRDANALRRLHRAHREAAKSPEPDEARLEPVVAEGLGGLLDLYNNFAFADSGLRAKDEARVAPQERANAEAEATAAIPLVRAILANPEIATPEALDDIVAELENAELPARDAYADQVLDQSNRTKRNIVAGLISDTWAAFKSTGVMGQAIAGGAAWDGVKLTATIIGGIDYAPLMQFIATNPGLLQHYVTVAFPTFEHLSELIDRIRLYWLARRKD